MRALDELVDEDGAGKERVQALLARAVRPAQWLDCEAAHGEATLLKLQLDTRSALGALAHGSGGLVVDSGWLRVLGAGCPALPRDLAGWNKLGEPGGRLPGALLIADDAVGGFFALNQGGLLGNPGDVCWLSPRTLEWEGLGIGYDGFLEWALCGELVAFYAPWRFAGWEDAVKTLGGGEAFAFEPFAAVDGVPLGERKRVPTPLDTLWTQHSDALPRLLRAP